MKYIFIIILLSISVIPFLLWDLIVGIWLFRFDSLRHLWKSYSDTIQDYYRRAFPRKPKRYKSQTF